jgi:alpha-tubulin suppressor-like RCC1 family protein
VRVRRVASFVLAVTTALGVGLVACSATATAKPTSVGVDAWGYNGDGQLGNGTVSRSDPASAVKGLRNVVAIAAGGYHSLALLHGGTVMSWGFNKRGQLGNASTGTNGDRPKVVNGLSAVRAISAGTFDSLALLSNGTVMALHFTIAVTLAGQNVL